MKYNVKYDLYVSKDGLVYRVKNDKLILANACYTKDGYVQVHTKAKTKMVHRIVYETFVGNIPKGLEIDHINDVRDDNYLENLRLVTRKENNNKSSRCRRISEANKGKKRSDETKQKMSKAKKGKKLSDETRRKLSESHKGIRKGRSWYIGSDGKRHWQ